MAKNLLNIIIAFFMLQIVSISCNDSDGETDMELIPVQLDDKCGYVDHKGKYVINPQFKFASSFHEGLALVYTLDNKVGYINKEGKFVIPANYMDGTHFCGGRAFVVTEESTPICVDANGKELFRVSDSIFTASFFTKDGLSRIVSEDGKRGYVNKRGELVISAKYQNAHHFNEGLAAVQEDNGKFGFINTRGQYIINPQFEKVYDFEAGLAAVKLGNQYGYIDKDGAFVINPQFDNCGSFCNGLASVQLGKKWGVINEKGAYVVNPQFDYIGSLKKNGLARFKQNGKYGYVDKNGKIVINPQFDYASDFNGDIAFVKIDDKWGAIEESGKYVINPQFDAINDYNFDAPGTIYALGHYLIGETVYNTSFNETSILDLILDKNQWLNDTYDNTIGKTAEMGEYSGETYLESGIIVQSPETKDGKDELSFAYIFDRNLNSPKASEAKLIGYCMVWSLGTEHHKTMFYIDKVIKSIERTEKVKSTLCYGVYPCAGNESAMFLFSGQENKIVFFASKDKKFVGKLLDDAFDGAKSNNDSYNVQPNIKTPSNNSVQSYDMNKQQSDIPGDYPDASTRILTSSELSGYSKRELKIMRNEIFARHGYIFKTDDMKNHFASKSWYEPKYNDVNSMLSDIEQQNIKTIQQLENR